MSETQKKLALEVEHYRKLARGNYFTVWFLYLLSPQPREFASYDAVLFLVMHNICARPGDAFVRSPLLGDLRHSKK